MQVKITDIIITNRKRTLKPEYVIQLAESIHEIGLLNPITLSSDNKLLSGLHRLEAVKLLGIEYIECHVVVSGGILYEELIEIDENLIRNDLTILEQGQQLNRRDEILKALGQRAGIGDNQYSKGGELNSLPKTTAEIAKESGISERTAQHYKQIDKGIDDSVKDMIRDTDIADNKTDLLALAKEKNPEKQKELAIDVISGKSINVKTAKKKRQLQDAKDKVIEQGKQSIQTNLPKIYHSDCVTWLNKQEKCDLLLTDPPYMTDVDNIDDFVKKWLFIALDKVKDTGSAYVFIGAYPEELKSYLNAEIPNHIKLVQILIWTYKNTIGRNPKNQYKTNYQNILYYKGLNSGNLDCPLTSEQWAVQEIDAPDGRLGNRFHTWQKPDGLAERFIRHSSKPNDIIYDPFVCTGTFILVGNKLGRLSSGCDISHENLDIAIQRGCIYG